MSTVLTNGIIIPENGSRNWGGDLANNWNIIDLNVGYMTDVKNRVTTLENSVAENSANIQINTSNISALQTSKQDTIEDLETIRAGASSGATAVQPSALNNYVDLSSEQTIGGTKTFNGVVLGERLGTSSKKWKTLNDINLGALSLPSSTDKIEISIPQGSSTYTPPSDGWLQVAASTQNFLLSNGLGMTSRFFFYPMPGLTNKDFGAYVPCRKGIVCNIYIDTATTGYFFQSQGNV